MDPEDPFRSISGRTEWALVTALLVPLLLVGVLMPSRPPSDAITAPGELGRDAAELATEPPTALVAPPAAPSSRLAARAIPGGHRSKADAFDAAFERSLAAHAAALADREPKLARIELTLVDAMSGAPIPGAVVELAREGLRHRRRADAHGILACDLPPGGLMLVAWDGSTSGGPLHVALEAGRTTREEIALHRASEVTGRVIHAGTGRPIPGATVAFWTHAELDRAETDADGRFVHHRFPTHAPEQQVRIEAPGFAPAVRYLSLSASGAWTHHASHVAEGDVTGAALPARVDVALNPELVLTGRILDASGRAVADAQVTAIGFARVLPDIATCDEAGAVTAADGTFRLHGLRPDTSHALHVVAPENAELVHELPAVLDAGVGDTVDLGDLRLDAPALVAGVLVDSAGVPIVDARVQLRRLCLDRPAPTTPADPGARPLLANRSFSTDEAGAFLFEDLAPGRYELRARRDRGRLTTREIDVALGEARADIRLTPDEPTWTLQGMLHTPNGPLAGASVQVERFGTIATVATDAEGRFRLAGLDDLGSYTVRAAEAGFTAAETAAWAWEPVALEVTADMPAVAIAKHENW